MELSSSVNNYSISQTLRDLDAREAMFPLTEAWDHFLRDHRELIRAKSSWVTLTEETMLRYRYRIREFVTTVLELPPDAELAFRVVNRLGCNSDFNLTLDGCWAPDRAYILELRHRFDTCRSQEASVDEEG